MILPELCLRGRDPVCLPSLFAMQTSLRRESVTLLAKQAGMVATMENVSQQDPRPVRM